MLTVDQLALLNFRPGTLERFKDATEMEFFHRYELFRLLADALNQRNVQEAERLVQRWEQFSQNSPTLNSDMDKWVRWNVLDAFGLNFLLDHGLEAGRVHYSSISMAILMRSSPQDQPLLVPLLKRLKDRWEMETLSPQFLISCLFESVDRPCLSHDFLRHLGMTDLDPAAFAEVFQIEEKPNADLHQSLFQYAWARNDVALCQWMLETGAATLHGVYPQSSWPTWSLFKVIDSPRDWLNELNLDAFDRALPYLSNFRQEWLTSPRNPAYSRWDWLRHNFRVLSLDGRLPVASLDVERHRF